MFYISNNASMPDIEFNLKTPSSPPYEGSWEIEWIAKVSGLRESSNRKSVKRTFKSSGTFLIKDKDSDCAKWKANLNNQIIGGKLTVKINTSEGTKERSVIIKGVNPSQENVKTYIDTLDNVKGFEKIIYQETRGKNFINADGQPIVAFDGGYGITQLTNPSPTYEQAWNWKENIKAGSTLYQIKQKAAKSYLSQKGRTYTDEQLRLETWCRWNGGSYHVWNAKENKWVRPSHIICDTNTGNIGWDLNNKHNKDKKLSELRKRDIGTYNSPTGRPDENAWKYLVVCYADHIANI